MMSSNTIIGNIRAGKMLDDMSTFEIARWQALMDAVEIIHEKCIDKKINFDKVDIKPLAVSKFIESTCDIYARNIERQRKQEQIIDQNRAQYASLPKYNIEQPINVL